MQKMFIQYHLFCITLCGCFSMTYGLCAHVGCNAQVGVQLFITFFGLFIIFKVQNLKL
ncbi:MAG: hypothetical protein JWO03_2498 [Bacteroidetes bacterium]|nr:hypothetical protein [Bacteroidota bacterium]